MLGQISYVWGDGRWMPMSTGTIGADAFVNWLVADIDQEESRIDWYLNEIARAAKVEVQSPQRKSKQRKVPKPDPYFVGAGNGMFVWANENLVYLECMWVDELRLVMTPEQVREALARYRPITQRGWKKRHTRPDSFEIEYVAEGQEAARLAAEAGLI